MSWMLLLDVLAFAERVLEAPVGDRSIKLNGQGCEAIQAMIYAKGTSLELMWKGENKL